MPQQWVQKGNLKGAKGDPGEPGAKGEPGSPGKSMRAASIDVGSNTDVALSAISPNVGVAADDLIVDAKGELYTVTAVTGDTVHVSNVIEGVTLKGPKGDPGEGADVPVATPEQAGKVKPGADFDVAADGTLSLYQAVKVTSLTGGGSHEVGETVDSVTLAWTINKQPASLEIDGEAVERGEDGSWPKSRTLSGLALKADRTFALKATDARGASDTKTTTVTFRSKAYWGAAEPPQDIDSAFVLGLEGSELASSRAKEFTVDAEASEVIYYAVPRSFGEPTFFVGGFEGGFALAKSLDLVNASGATVAYDVWASANVGLGATTVTVE